MKYRIYLSIFHHLDLFHGLSSIYFNIFLKTIPHLKLYKHLHFYPQIPVFIIPLFPSKLHTLTSKKRQTFYSSPLIFYIAFAAFALYIPPYLITLSFRRIIHRLHVLPKNPNELILRVAPAV